MNTFENPKICHQHFKDSCFKWDLEVNIIFFTKQQKNVKQA